MNESMVAGGREIWPVWEKNSVYGEQPARNLPGVFCAVKDIHTPQHLQYLYGNHMYFADNRRSFEGKIDPVRFGRINLLTNTVDFVQPITASPTSQILEIVEHQDLVYVRNTGDELFVFEVAENG